MAEISPFPWAEKKMQFGGRHVVDANGKTIVYFDIPRVNEADIPLVIAAPELLASLEAVVRNCVSTNTEADLAFREAVNLIDRIKRAVA